MPSLTALENGLQDRMTHRPGDMSGGQQQRVAVAWAIALDPQLIQADEPTAHLDLIQVEEILRPIRELASDDRMLVVATHDSRILPPADRIMELVPELATTNRPPEWVKLEEGVLAAGELEIVHQVADGGEELLMGVKAGDYFGGIGPLFNLFRSATVRARIHATVIGYTMTAFRERLGVGGAPDLIEHRTLTIEH